MKIYVGLILALLAAAAIASRHGHYHWHHCWDTTEGNAQLLKESRPGHRFTETQSLDGRWRGCENSE
jgi:hypothetical protein